MKIMKVINEFPVRPDINHVWAGCERMSAIGIDGDEAGF